LKLLVDADDWPFFWQNETYILYFLPPLSKKCSRATEYYCSNRWQLDAKTEKVTSLFPVRGTLTNKWASTKITEN